MTMKIGRFLARSLGAQLVFALTLGSLTGFLGGSKVGVLGEVGVFIIKILKFLAIPLVFFAITEAFSKVEIPVVKGLKLLFLSTTNACVALIIALTLSYGLPLKKWVDFKALSEAIGAGQVNTSPNLPELSLHSFLQTFLPPNILGFILIAIILGLFLRKIKNPDLDRLIECGLRYVSTALALIVRILPLAVFAIISKVVGASGFKVFSALALFVFVVTLGLFIHVFIYYSLLLVLAAKKSPLRFFQESSEPLLTAFSVGSSLATLPVTLRTLQEKMKISPASSRLAACVGTNLNHDGILLYEAVAALFVAQIQSISLTFHQQMTLCLTSVVAAVGIAGVPDAGFITLSLVFGAVGLPLAAVPLLLPVDWFIGRLRATTNVSSDMVVATLLDQ